jgi:hypothetical protein
MWNYWRCLGRAPSVMEVQQYKSIAYMQPHHQINHNNVFYLTVLTNVTLASSNSALPEDGDYTKTSWICFNVNFNTTFKKLVHQLV